MNNVSQNKLLFQNICDSVRKWFEKDRDYETTFSVTQSDSYRAYVFPKVVIGDTEHDAELEIGVVQWDDDCRHYCWMQCYLTFDTEIKADKEDNEVFVLRLINRLNFKNPSRSIYYDTESDHICIYQKWNFYPGAEVPDAEIAKLIDDFVLDRDTKNICDVIEAGGWRFPEVFIYNTPLIIDSVK